MRYSSIRTINKRGGVQNRSQGLDDTRSGAVCKRLLGETELSPQSKVNQGMMRVCLVQLDRATLHRKLSCMNRVRSTRLWKSEN